MNKNSIILLVFFSLFHAAWAQAPSDPDELYKAKNYLDALAKYLTKYNANKNDPEINYRIAYCYMHTNQDKRKAIPYLEFVTKQAKFEDDAWWYLGKAYHLANKFDDAINCYKKYAEKSGGKEKEKALRNIEMCNTAKELIKKPLDVSFYNLGKEVNTEFPDYYPFIPANESFIVYTSRRKNPGAMKQFDGYYSSDIMISEVKNGEFQKAKPIGGGINTGEDEECVGLTPNGQYVLIYIDHQKTYGDIYESERSPKGWSTPKVFSETVNTTYLETSASINMDGNVLVFASDRPGGQGGTDIYIAKLLPDGTWTEAVNMGPDINTKYNEDFPQLTEDGKTLYFCSEGHASMGGYDIFKSKYNEETKHWSKPTNIGYPINTSDDDMHYAVSGTEHEAYISGVRDGGLGDLDIWRVIFNNVESRMTFVKGAIFLNDSTHFASEDIQISVTDKKTNAPVQIKNKETGDAMDAEFWYRADKKKYSMALEPGHYIVTIEVPGYEKYSEELNLMDKSDFKMDVKKNIYLYKPGSKPSSPGQVKPKTATPTKK